MTRATQPQLEHCVRGLVRGNVAHTLAYCLFWAQHATHEFEGRPAIYKTGREIAGELPITPRTANEHLKALAKAGYWKIIYRPKPGGVTRVSWLFISDRSLELIEAAKTIDLSGGRRKSQFSTAKSLKTGHSDDVVSLPHTSEIPTSIKPITPYATTSPKSFILTKPQGKNETHPQCQGKGEGLKPPSWMKTDPGVKVLARTVRDALTTANLPDWDWTSQFTWRHLAEIRAKLKSRGYDSREAEQAFIADVIEHWSWLRFVMSDRYAQHGGNFHRPTPLALAVEFNRILEKIEGKRAELTTKTGIGGTSNLDSDLDGGLA